MHKRALVMIRAEPCYRRDAFCAGLEAAGYRIVSNCPDPTPADVCLIWNRYGSGDQVARRFEAAGARAVVAENGYIGRDWRGGVWYALAIGRHNGAGRWFVGDDTRAKELFAGLVEPWRTGGETVLVLGTRSIGVAPVAEPRGWAARVYNELKAWGVNVELRAHPGKTQENESLYKALERARCAITWGSTAGLKAILYGVPVFYGFSDWIGAAAAARYENGTLANEYTGDRARMLRALSWAFWNLDELGDGSAFRYLLRGTE